MATTEGLTLVTHPAAADLSGSQYRIVTLGASGVTLCGSNGLAFGVLQNEPKSGEAAAVATIEGGGTAKVVSDGSGTAIAAGDWVRSGINGVAVKGGGVGDNNIGIALDASAASGIVIRVALRQRVS